MRGGSLFGLLRDSREVVECSQALRRLAAKQPVWTGAAEINTSRGLMLQGKWQESADYLYSAIAFYKEVGLTSQLMSVKLDEAELASHQNQIDEGLALIDQAVADSEELAQIRSPALRLQADLLAHKNVEPSVVETAYTRALECASSQGAKYYELQTATAFARWLESQDRGADARTILAARYNWFTEGFDTLVLKEAKALLDKLNDNQNPRRSNRPQRSRRPYSPT